MTKTTSYTIKAPGLHIFFRNDLYRGCTIKNMAHVKPNHFSLTVVDRREFKYVESECDRKYSSGRSLKDFLNTLHDSVGGGILSVAALIPREKLKRFTKGVTNHRYILSQFLPQSSIFVLIN